VSQRKLHLHRILIFRALEMLSLSNITIIVAAAMQSSNETVLGVHISLHVEYGQIEDDSNLQALCKLVASKLAAGTVSTGRAAACSAGHELMPI
jgi:hypothetical protein